MSSDAPPPPPSGSAPATARAAAPAAAASSDVVLLGGPTADGAGVHVLRARNEHIETGELRVLEQGKPIAGEVLTLKPREGSPRICDVTDSFAVPSSRGAGGARGAGDAGGAGPAAKALGHKGPAKVATKAYREGWDEIFGAKPKPPGPAN